METMVCRHFQKLMDNSVKLDDKIIRIFVCFKWSTQFLTSPFLKGNEDLQAFQQIVIIQD